MLGFYFFLFFLACITALQPTNVYSTRRQFATGIVASTIATVGNPSVATADPFNALLPAGSGGLMGSYQETVEGWSGPNSLETKLGSSRIGATSLAPLQQTNPFASQELYYPPFLFGSWDVTATLKAKTYPFGKDFVPSRSLLEGSPRNRSEKPGDRSTYQLHFFSTLADTAANQVTVNLGLGIPQTKIIADRSFNAISTSRGYNQVLPVEGVDWDYRAEPTRLTYRFGATPMTDDMRPLGQRRTEIYLSARQSESGVDDSIFCAAERSRSVALGPGSVVTSDQEIITEFKQIDADTVEAQSRIAVYLTPNPNSREGILWQQVGGKAVAFFDYEWTMKRLKEEFTLADKSTVLKACVRTPKDVVQCQ